MGASKHCKSVSFQIGLFPDPHLWPWILGNDRKSVISSSAEMRFLRRVHSVALCKRKCTCETCKAWMWSPFLESKDLRHGGSVTRPECPGKDRRGTSCWQHPRKRYPEIARGLDVAIIPSTSLGPFIVRNQQNYQRLLKTARYFESS